MVVLLAVGVGVFALSGTDASDARSVDDVADLAVEAAEDLDVEKGIDLLCAAPDDRLRDELEDLIAEAQDRAGTDDPEVDYRISDVSDGSTGTFEVEVTSEESGLEGEGAAYKVFVAKDGERSCIAGVGDPGDDEPAAEFG